MQPGQFVGAGTVPCCTPHPPEDWGRQPGGLQQQMETEANPMKWFLRSSSFERAAASLERGLCRGTGNRGGLDLGGEMLGNTRPWGRTGGTGEFVPTFWA